MVRQEDSPTNSFGISLMGFFTPMDWKKNKKEAEQK